MSENTKLCSKFEKGDANCDTKINMMDYSSWIESYRNETIAGDFNNDGMTDELDYAIWWQNYDG
jgi:hypothetical protein